MKFLRVHQKLVSNPIADIRAAVREQLDRLKLKVPQGDVGITAGSRGIANIAEITRAAGDWLREHGARPFLFPAMGSHNGGTAEGQRAMIESLGITEEAMGMPIRASMDVVKLGTVSTGDVWMDRHAYRIGRRARAQSHQAAHVLRRARAKRAHEDDGRRHGQNALGHDVSLGAHAADERDAARDGPGRARLGQDLGRAWRFWKTASIKRPSCTPCGRPTFCSASRS